MADAEGRTGEGRGRAERLGIVSYTNVAPLHWQLEPWEGARFVRGVPTELNRQLLDGDIDLTLISSVEFLRHRHELRALADFSISTLGPVYSVMLFHWWPWEELSGRKIALTTHSVTSVQLLKVLLHESRLEAELVPMQPDLDAMLARCDAALLIGDGALQEAVWRRDFGGRRPRVTDLGAAWYELTRLPFTFAVWAARKNAPPSTTLVGRLRAAREQGLGCLREVARAEAARLGLPVGVVQRYLGNFRYYLEPPDRDGLLAFAERAVPDFDPDELVFWER
ncbi:MAG TPA: menaquinone biosynthesis protein [Trueperaceae bacterium]